jgi:hypothetical protein
MANERKIQESHSRNRGGREPYPAVRQDDAVELTEGAEPETGERRSFAPGAEIDESWLGPRGDPAEGKR